MNNKEMKYIKRGIALVFNIFKYYVGVLICIFFMLVFSYYNIFPFAQMLGLNNEQRKYLRGILTGEINGGFKAIAYTFLFISIVMYIIFYVFKKIEKKKAKEMKTVVIKVTDIETGEEEAALFTIFKDSIRTKITPPILYSNYQNCLMSVVEQPIGHAIECKKDNEDV